MGKQNESINKIAITHNPKPKMIMKVTFTADSYNTRVRLEKRSNLSVQECIFMLENYINTLKKNINVKK